MTPTAPEPFVPADRATRLRTSERVTEILSDRIRSGLYHAGDPLPTERALAADLQVHRRSVRAAIEDLVRVGLVSRRPNCRPTVGPASDETLTARGRGTTENVRRRTAPPISASNLVALIMWHGGGPLEQSVSSQQRIFWGMNRSLMQRGYHAVFLDLGTQVGTDEENAAREAEHLRYIRDHKFGGALFYPYAYRHNRDLVREVSRTVPLVLLDRNIAGVPGDFVGIENHGALFQTTRHLIAQGHRRIAHVTRIEPIQSIQDRIQGYVDAIRSADAPDMAEMILHVPPFAEDFDLPAAWTAVDSVFRLPEGRRPTAAACSNDYMAATLARRLAFLGLSIPADVALTGVDDIISTLPDGTGLTTMAQPYEEIGATAAELLMRRLHARHSPPQSVELPTQLIVRDSSAA